MSTRQTRTLVSILILVLAVLIVTVGCANTKRFNPPVERGDLLWVKRLIERGADVNEMDNGTTVLNMALYGGHAEIAKLLIKAGADVNLQTSLWIATKEGYTDIVKLLIEAGANVNVQNEDGETLLIIVLHGHTEIVKLIIEAGADINARDYQGRIALVIAWKPEIEQLLIEAGSEWD